VRRFGAQVRCHICTRYVVDYPELPVDFRHFGCLNAGIVRIWAKPNLRTKHL